MKNLTLQHKLALRVLPILISTALLTACVDEDIASMSNNTASGTSTNDTASVVLSGSIGDGPVIGATIIFTDNSGAFLATTTSDEMTNYTVEIPSDTAFPVIITATGGIDVVTNAPLDFTMLSVAEDANQGIANINPFSTLIVKTALAMPGGLDTENLDIAKQTVMQKLNFGLDSTLMADPISTPVTEENVANIVKASEAFAETIRRTNTALLVINASANEDQVIKALAADMTDGQLDGIGEEGSDPLFSATANVVSGQVLIETLSNNLYVNGIWATDLLDNAILITMPTATETTADVVITSEIITQTKLAIKAAQAAAPSDALSSISATLERLSAGDGPVAIGALMPANRSYDVDSAISSTVLSPINRLNTINSAGNTPSLKNIAPAENAAPVGNGTTAEKLTIVAAHASSYDAARGRLPGNAIDGDSTTKWTTYGTQWIVLDLGPNKTLSKIRLKFYGSNRGMNHTYTIATSLDNTNWDDQTINATFDAISPNWTEMSLNLTEAKYVKISIDALNADDYLSMYEIEAYGQANDSDTGSKVALSWVPVSNALGYMVYYGPTADNATNQLLDIPIATNGFDPQAPKTEFDAENDLGLTSGESICFSLRAYNNEGQSEPSSPVCGYI